MVVSQIQSIDLDDFPQEVLHSDLSVLVEFRCDWCPICHLMQPVLEGLAREFEGRIKVVTVTVGATSDEFTRLGICELPTFMLVDHGRKIGNFGRAVKDSQLKDVLDHFLASSQPAVA